MKPKPLLFDLEHLVATINDSLENPDDELLLGPFAQYRTLLNPLQHMHYRLSDRKIETRGVYPLTQSVVGGSIVSSLLGLETERSAGYAFLETGHTNASSVHGIGRYEIVELRITQPLALNDGTTIPHCNIKFLQDAEEWCEPRQERRDHIRKYSLFWLRSDLRNVLPSDWFIPPRTYTSKSA